MTLDDKSLEEMAREIASQIAPRFMQNDATELITAVLRQVQNEALNARLPSLDQVTNYVQKEFPFTRALSVKLAYEFIQGNITPQNTEAEAAGSSYRLSQDCPSTWDGASLERGFNAGVCWLRSQVLKEDK